MKIIYNEGDIFDFVDKDKRVIIPHICNDIGKWGKGFVKALSKYNDLPEKAYKEWYDLHDNTSELKNTPDIFYSKKKSLQLSRTQIVKCNANTYIANMIAQKGIYTDQESHPPIRYWALAYCMKCVQEVILSKTIRIDEIYAPMFGSGLALGKWEYIETLINELWIQENIPVNIFHL